MKIIGITGQSGAGKSTVCESFQKYGIPCIDTDKLYHSMLCKNSPLVCELVRAFGLEITDWAGGIHRPTLAKRVFSSKDDLSRLNTIAHFHILSRSRELIKEYEEQGCDTVAVDASQLFESGFDKECDVTLAVVADRQTLIDRITKRDGISREGAEKRLENQFPKEYFIKKCTYVIENRSDAEALDRAVKNIVNIIKGGTNG